MAWRRRIGARGEVVSPHSAAKEQFLALSVQLFGRKDSRETQKALRFFKERRVSVTFVDVSKKPPAAGELRRFSQRFGALQLVDTRSRQYSEQGLAYMRLDEDETFQRLLAEPRLLRLPLVRAGTKLSVGDDEAAWREWLADD